MQAVYTAGAESAASSVNEQGTAVALEAMLIKSIPPCLGRGLSSQSRYLAQHRLHCPVGVLKTSLTFRAVPGPHQLHRAQHSARNSSCRPVTALNVKKIVKKYGRFRSGIDLSFYVSSLSVWSSTATLVPLWALLLITPSTWGPSSGDMHCRQGDVASTFPSSLGHWVQCKYAARSTKKPL